jgi:hypothetical protein
MTFLYRSGWSLVCFLGLFSDISVILAFLRILLH